MERPASSAPPSHPRPGTRDFRLLWWASTVDGLGSQASGAVLPLLLLGLGHSPQVVGAIAGVSTALGLLLGPLVAVPADRGARRRVMLGSATVSALAMGGVTLALTAGDPPLALILAAVLTERTATACFEAAARGTVALVCPGPAQPRAVARLTAGDQGALVVGPALGGALYQAARALPFLADALSYAVSALCIRAMRADLTAPAPHKRDAARGREGTAGLRMVRSSPLLRLVLVWSGTVNLVVVALYFTAVFALQRAGHGGAVLGAVLAASGAAGLAGALAAPRVAKRFGAPRVVTGVTWLLVPLTAALATATGAWAYGVLFSAVCLLMPLASVVLQARALQATAPAVQARTGAVLATATTGAAALAPVLAGVLADGLSTAAPAWACGAALVLLAAHTSRRPVRGALTAEAAA
ncbi:MFS transporter [Streptomyces sp. WAC05374]|uniref:MFS transporter n=1 Tax=Streptomyces sp. WAC05374 TaxID=2487420 RepID=UPI000F89B2F0|nr:MFS transporter [Streptomyces sp. WAC05374]RST12612.1 MFS transporter [Streptomyces sp. WAC05374]TDF50265.1 MFS transporter [Streptomyces sp. WAC05374]TDF57989.1 MFS transporter [Streptomyces sp. WAC05374]TDF60518.1 MFS transporter [Streptomyces sp. WAC05374]